MTAAPLAQRLAEHCEIVLIESPDIGTIGVGEATLPTIRYYNAALGLDHADFLRRTKASFKLGIEFKNWGHVGHRFFHGFGDFGPRIDNRSPHLHWLRLARSERNIPSYENWSMATVMARNDRFTPPGADDPYLYGYHFDAGLYATCTPPVCASTRWRAVLSASKPPSTMSNCGPTMASSLPLPPDGFLNPRQPVK